MKAHSHPRFRPLLALAILSLLAGCSMMPTKPAIQREETRARVVQTVDLEASTPAPTDSLEVVASKTVVGLVGGTVSAGHFTVVVPPLAFVGVATVTAKVPFPDASQCELGISPEDKNQFLTPVMLVANMDGLLPPDLVARSHVQWLNPATGKWQQVHGSTVDLANLTVSAPLQHFSQYRVSVEGRASW